MAQSRATLRVLPPPAGFAGAGTVVTAVLVVACALTTLPALVSGYLQDDETPAGPSNVSIVSATHALEAGRPGQLRCVSFGSRPPAQLSWWKGSQRLPDTTTTMEASGVIDGPVSSSTLRLTPSVEDDGRQIRCRAVNERLPVATVEDVATIRVLYKPQVVVRLGSPLRMSSILENTDVYFECSVTANPPVSEINWLFEGRDLHTNTSAGIIISNRALVLQKVGRSARGHYQCVAANSLGQSRSEPLFLRVQFAPVCHESQMLIYGAAMHEPLQVPCDVDADPPEVTFHWHLTHSVETVIPNSMQGATRSVATFIARSEADYGTLSCKAGNSVGIQQQPCLFRIVPTGPHEPPGLRALANQTEEALQSWDFLPVWMHSLALMRRLKLVTLCQTFLNEMSFISEPHANLPVELPIAYL